MKRSPVSGRRARVAAPAIAPATLAVGAAAWIACAAVAIAATEHAGTGAAATLSLGTIEGEAFALRDVALHLDLDRASARLDVGSLSLPPPLDRVSRLSGECPVVTLERRGVACPRALLVLGRHGAPPLELSARLRYAARNRSLHVAADDVALAGGRLSFSLELGSAGAALEVAASGLVLSELRPRVGGTAPGEGVGIDDGQLHFSLVASTSPDGTAALRGEAELVPLAFSNESGRLAGEALVARATFEAERRDGTPWTVDVEAGIGAGGVYAEPVYLDFSSYPLAFSATGSVDPEAGALHVDRFELEQPGLATLGGSLTATRDQPLERLVLEVERAALPGAYEAYLQGVLVGTPLDRLDVVGTVTGGLELTGGQPSRASFRLRDLDLEDRDGRFALYGANGELYWQRAGERPRDSRLAFDGGYLFGAGFDGAELAVRAHDNDAALLAPVRVPMLGGALDVRRLRVEDWDSDGIALELEAEVEPIELRQLTLALDWPPFGGTLSGRLPLLTLRDGVVTLGGDLVARAFDGDISIEDLEIRRPFGIVPEFAATIRLRNLDLGLLTGVVAFGSVSGRLDGDIEGLRLIKGKPIGFDARFRTPEGDDSKHRISQRAVGTISKVAGGSGAVLSSTFLRVFESFPYSRLGISCRLENDVCHMDGIGPADGGYYIVEGSLLPRLNLIGRVRQVNWSRMMSQLTKALEEGRLRVD